MRKWCGQDDKKIVCHAFGTEWNFLPLDYLFKNQEGNGLSDRDTGLRTGLNLAHQDSSLHTGSFQFNDEPVRGG